MKFGRLRTIRGEIDVVGGQGKKNIILADGLINYGLKIMKFNCWKQDQLAGAFEMSAILSLDVIGAAQTAQAGDNRQFAWSTIERSASVIILPASTIIDPDHIVNRDLFLNLNATNGRYNYLIECQVVELTDDEAIISIIKENSQS